MRAILTALILGIAVASVASPALAADQEHEPGGSDRVLPTSYQDTVQISVGAAGGSDEQAPAMPERFEKN